MDTDDGTPMYHKVVTFVPVDSLGIVVDALKASCVNDLGSYRNCMSWSPVMSTWTPMPGANPYIGSVDVTSTEEEYRLEMLVSDDDVTRVVNVIASAHPYEEPEIDVYDVTYGLDMVR